MAPIYRLGTDRLWNGLKTSSEWKSLADLAFVLMTTPLAEVDNEGIFSLRRDMIGIHAAGTTTELLHVRAPTKLHSDPK
jgi:hypothetical protein